MPFIRSRQHSRATETLRSPPVKSPCGCEQSELPELAAPGHCHTARRGRRPPDSGLRSAAPASRLPALLLVFWGAWPLCAGRHPQRWEGRRMWWGRGSRRWKVEAKTQVGEGGGQAGRPDTHAVRPGEGVLGRLCLTGETGPGLPGGMPATPQTPPLLQSSNGVVKDTSLPRQEGKRASLNSRSRTSGVMIAISSCVCVFVFLLNSPKELVAVQWDTNGAPDTAWLDL